MSKKSTKPTIDLIGSFYGERAISAPFMMIASKSPNETVIGRSKFGGVVLSDFCTTQGWERWRGTMILIPTRVDHFVSPSTRTLQDMLLSFMNVSDDYNKNSDTPIWNKAWEGNR